MSASTIGRTTLTDGAGGTVLNNALWQSSIYDKVDALIAAAITFGSTVSAEGFGTHSFSAGGTGGNIFSVRNTTAGTGNYGLIRVGNNSLANTGEMFATSSTFTPSNDQLADCLSIRGNGAGGISIASTGSGSNSALRVWANGVMVAAFRSPTSVPTTLNLTEIDSLGAQLNVCAISTATAAATLQSGEPGVNSQYVIVANNYHGTTGAASARFNTSVGGSFLRLGRSTFEIVSVDASGTLSSRMSMDSSGNFTIPGTVAMGDAAFRNRFVLTEHDKIEREAGSMPSGLAVLNADGDAVAFFDDAGRLHVTAVVADLRELPWRRTTAEERAVA